MGRKNRRNPMSEIIPFQSDNEWPDLEHMTEAELRRELSGVWEQLATLDFQEPEDMNSEEYEAWGERHEELEDLADEIQDLLDEV